MGVNWQKKHDWVCSYARMLVCSSSSFVLLPRDSTTSWKGKFETLYCPLAWFITNCWRCTVLHSSAHVLHVFNANLKFISIWFTWEGHELHAQWSLSVKKGGAKTNGFIWRNMEEENLCLLDALNTHLTLCNTGTSKWSCAQRTRRRSNTH